MMALLLLCAHNMISCQCHLKTHPSITSFLIDQPRHVSSILPLMSIYLEIKEKSTGSTLQYSEFSFSNTLVASQWFVKRFLKRLCSVLTKLGKMYYYNFTSLTFFYSFIIYCSKVWYELLSVTFVYWSIIYYKKKIVFI